ncbi:hypothetical protein ABTH36_19550, partial [Acinetobacter baumannii]
GVAAEDWTLDHLREHARTSIEQSGETIDDEVFGRLAARLGYVGGDFTDAATYQRVADAVGDADNPVFYLEIPPSLFGRVVEGVAEAKLVGSGQRVV